MKTNLTLLFLSISIALLAQEKTFEREYTYKASEMDSKISCRAIAINQVRSILLNEIGVYVESESILKTSDVSGQFSQDFVENIATISAGITKLEVLEEKWNGESFWMRASITIDRENLEESLKQLVADRKKSKEFEELKEKLDEASKEIDRLKEEASKNQSIDKTEQKLKYNVEINTLLALDYFYKGNAKSTIQDYRGAIADYTKVIELHPDASAYYNRGNGMFDLKDYTGAIADFTKAIDINPEYASAYFNRGLSKHALNDYQGAIADYTKAITFNPDAEAYYNRGLLKYVLEDNRGSMVDLTKAIDISPDHVDAHFIRGLLRHDLDDNQGAIADFTKVIEINPEYSDAYLKRGFSKYVLDDYRGAISDYTKAIELHPDEETYYNRGLSKDALNDYRGAIADYTKAIAINSEYADSYYARALMNFMLGEKDKGCMDLSKAGELGLERAYELIKKGCK